MFKIAILLATFILTIACGENQPTATTPLTAKEWCGISCAFTFADLPANINAAPGSNAVAGQAFVKECIPKCLACGNLSSDAAVKTCLNNIK